MRASMHLAFCATAIGLALTSGCGNSGSPGAPSDGGSTCARHCTQNADCDFAQACRGGCCVPGCDEDQDCQSPAVCRADHCVAPDADAGSPSDGGAARDGGALRDGGTAPRDGGVANDGGLASDGGAVADGGGGVPNMSCAGTPTQCSDISSSTDVQYYGCCDGQTVYWCDDQNGTWELHNIDCTAQGKTCGYDPGVGSNYCTGGTPVDLDGGPPAGPGPDCPSLPPMTCTMADGGCGVLSTFNPRTNGAWDDYPLNGETAANQYRSFLRNDVIMLIKYASSKVACKVAGWTMPGNGPPIGLGDMSEANGAIPGTSIGQPGHPAGTHVNGKDIDQGYYQVGTGDNHLRPICEHAGDGGTDAYHCTAPPTSLDVWRDALYLGFLFEHPNVRVIGVDGKAGPLLDAAIDRLCSSGWLTTYACGHRKLTYEVTDEGRGWFLFHHHHQHLSFSPPAGKRRVVAGDPRSACIDEACDPFAQSAFRARFGLPEAPRARGFTPSLDGLWWPDLPDEKPPVPRKQTMPR